MQEEFLKLTQGSMTIDQYELRFVALNKYDAEMRNNEKKKVQRFLEGLKPFIQ